MSDRLYFRQLLAGRDFARDDAVARGMANFVYAIGDRETGEALLVDPAYRPLELAAILAEDDLTLVGVVATHYHVDHVGGTFQGRAVVGVAALLEAHDVAVHVARDEVTWVTRGTGVDAGQLVGHDSGDRIRVGEVEVTLVHTPGHTPGSQCLLVEGRLVSGDTLFLEGCGRTDLPGGDLDALYDTLTRRLADLPGETVLYPGHHYSSEPFAELARVRAINPALAPRSAEQWRAAFA